MSKLLEKVNGNWIFLAIVIAVYAIVAVADFSTVERALHEFILIFTKIMPIFVLVFFLMFFSHLLLSAKKISDFLGEEAGGRGWLISIVGGIISSGPIYMWYPLLSDLKGKGMKDGFVATFLYNRAVKIPMIPLLIYYFGLPYTIVLTLYMVLFSVVSGVLVEELLKVTSIKKV